MVDNKNKSLLFVVMLFFLYWLINKLKTQNMIINTHTHTLYLVKKLKMDSHDHYESNSRAK